MKDIMKKTCYLTRIMNEELLIFHQLTYYYNMGIRFFYITFNNSNEKTIQEVEKFQEKYSSVCVYRSFEANTEFNQIETFDKMSNEAYRNGHIWQIPSDADEVLMLKKESLSQFLERHDSNPYGYINFRWVDYHPTKDDNDSDVNFFSKWKHRQVDHRGVTKIIYKWSIGCKHGHGNHLLTTKRKKLNEISMEQGFFAHFPNRGLKQISAKRRRIGEAFIQKYGYNSDKPQVLEYKRFEALGEQYFVDEWSKLCEKREKMKLIFDPLPESFLS